MSVDLAHPGAQVPKAFLGLSFEAASLARLASYGQRGDLMALLRSLGSGVLRFGGVTADTQVAWTDAQTPLLLSVVATASRSLTVCLARFVPRGKY
jgi:hypothetical protein